METIYEATTISHRSPTIIDGIRTNFGALYGVINGTAGVGLGTNVFADASAQFSSGMIGSTIVIPAQNLRLSITGYTNTSTIVLSGNVAAATGLVWYMDTTLSNLALGAVSVSVKFINATTWIDETGSTHTFAAGDYAITADTLTSLGQTLYTPSSGLPSKGIWCTLYTDQSTPCATIAEGLPGNIGGIEYEMEVMHNKIVSNVLQAPRIVGIHNFTVVVPPV